VHQLGTDGSPAGPGARPQRLVVVCGTGTEVGKTWVAAAVLRECRRRGLSVAARKPAQSFDADTSTGTTTDTDADVLAAASGEDPAAVCRHDRSFPVALAPPMAAEALGRAPFTLGDLVAELDWPRPPVSLGVVEVAGGVRSPQAADGDAIDLVRRLRPDAVVLVADAGLGTINAVRLSVSALATVTDGSTSTPPVPVVVALDRFDPALDVHRRNRQWLSDGDGLVVVVVPGDETALADLLVGPSGVAAVSAGR
jgi:dethiobiotin synthetase